MISPQKSAVRLLGLPQRPAIWRILRQERASRYGIMAVSASHTFLYRRGSSRVSPVLLTHLIKIDHAGLVNRFDPFTENV